MNSQTQQITDSHYEKFYRNLIPFGSGDVRAAIEHAIGAGESPEWAAEQITEFMNETRTNLEDIDPVYCVLYSILQHARTEIEKVIHYDFCNDGSGIDTYGNFMCSTYDYREEARQELADKLRKHDVAAEDLDEMTLYFLAEIEIDLNLQ